MYNIKIQLITIIIMVISQISCAQNNNIVGKWQEYKTEWTDSLSLAENSPRGCTEYQYEFKSNGLLEEPYGGPTFNYKLKGDTLYINELSRFQIIYFKKDSLGLLDLPTDDKNIIPLLHHFLRVNRFTRE